MSDELAAIKIHKIIIISKLLLPIPTWLLFISANGMEPRANISHTKTPNDQTSVFSENWNAFYRTNFIRKQNNKPMDFSRNIQWLSIEMVIELAYYWQYIDIQSSLSRLCSIWSSVEKVQNLKVFHIGNSKINWLLTRFYVEKEQEILSPLFSQKEIFLHWVSGLGQTQGNYARGENGAPPPTKWIISFHIKSKGDFYNPRKKFRKSKIKP